MSHHVDEKSIKTAILLLIFNRPEATELVFESVRKARPARLFVAADGPRSNREGEAVKCEAARKIAMNVDWPCEVKTLFREENVGCGRAVSGAITWFFEHAEEGIILEDDCLPDASFFPFCFELLARYRHDDRIMEISGNNMMFDNSQHQEYSYSFSNHNYIWGWATWRRAWKKYDYTLQLYKHIINKEYFKNYYYLRDEYEYMKYVLDKTYFNNSDITWWSYQWDFARKVNSGLVIVPARNMVVNIGVGAEATHTHDINGIGHHLKLQQTQFPLQHPEFVMIDTESDNKLFKKYFTNRFSRAKTFVKSVLPRKLLAHISHDMRTSDVL